MNQNSKGNFYIARLDEEVKETKKDDNKFVAPYSGRNVKNEMLPPTLPLMGSTKRYDDFRSEKNKQNKNDESKSSIPSYLRIEEPSITRRNIDDLLGKKLTQEEFYKLYSSNYGSYSLEFDEKKRKLEEQMASTPEVVATEDEDDYYDDIEFNESFDDFASVEVVPQEYVPSRPQPKEEDFTPYHRVPLHVEETVREVKKPNEPVKKTTPPVRKTKKYVFPPLDLLRRGGRPSASSHSDINNQINTIHATLEQFKVGGKVINYTKGPTVTQYEIKLDPGILVNKVESIAKNIQMNLAVASIRIEAPIPKKSTIGIEVPNVTKDDVLFGDMIAKEEFLHDGHPLNVVLGYKIDGEPLYIDIAEMPHAIVAGATNSGKTVCIHAIINSILYKATPDDVRLILIDPKSNEFMFYEGIPHLAAPIIDEPRFATATLQWATEEMARRLAILKQARKNKIADYNEAVEATGSGQKLPYIVIIIDEFADLMNMASDAFEESVQRLTQKARSVGIHMIIATQRPSVDVIKGTIKANIQTRIALKVNTQVDSFTILDHGGAEKLLGRGDALYTKGGNDSRIQCAFISTTEIEKVTEFLCEQSNNDYMFTLDELQDDSSLGDQDIDNPLSDPLFAKVAKYVVTYKNASMNQIQKHFSIGYNRADLIMQGLESLGIVSPVVHGKQRSVIVDLEDLEEILRNKG